MKRSILLSLLFLSIATFSFAQLKEVTTGPFESFKAFGPFKVTLIKSSNPHMEIDYNGINSDDVEILTRNHEVSLKIKTRHYWDWDFEDRFDGRYMQVKLYYKELENIEGRAGARIWSEGTLTASHLSIVGKMGAEIELTLDAQQVELEASMGAEVELVGKAERFYVEAKMGTEVKASHLECESVEASASMGADVSVYAAKELDANAGFGAEVRYAGDPMVKHTNTNFGADVRRTGKK
ncbi:MAG: DUF2807 domain-containing protein [Cyclobacteriaceae bacterium]|nr:DUF2807 domain-containing protein [Cyclobacteriaceae bacterium]